MRVVEAIYQSADAQQLIGWHLSSTSAGLTFSRRFTSRPMECRETVKTMSPGGKAA